MFAAPVVGEALEAEALQHGDSFFRVAFLGIEWHDAPGDEVVPVEQVRCWRSGKVAKWQSGGLTRAGEDRQGCRNENDKSQHSRPLNKRFEKNHGNSPCR